MRNFIENELLAKFGEEVMHPDFSNLKRGIRELAGMKGIRIETDQEINPLKDIHYIKSTTSYADCVFLYLLTRWINPRNIFEIGTHVGSSTAYMAKALETNNMGGVLYTCDMQYPPKRSYPKKYDRMVQFFNEPSGPVLKYMNECGVSGGIGMVFIDGLLDKPEVPYLESLLADKYIIAIHDTQADKPDYKGHTNIKNLEHLPGKRFYALDTDKSPLVFGTLGVNNCTSIILHKEGF